jgi:hypothetical protein
MRQPDIFYIRVYVFYIFPCPVPRRKLAECGVFAAYVIPCIVPLYSKIKSGNRFSRLNRQENIFFGQLPRLIITNKYFFFYLFVFTFIFNAHHTPPSGYMPIIFSLNFSDKFKKNVT